MAKQQSPQLQNTSQTDTTIPIKGMSKDPNSSLVSKENWTHAINAINNSDDGDVGTLGNEQANKKCGYAPFTIIGAIHLYGDKWVLFSTNNEQSEIGTWDDSECKYEVVINDYVCFAEEGGCEDPENFTPCLNFDTQHLITGASKENFDCSWQVYWDDGKNPSRTLNLDNIPYIQQQITGPPIDTSDCITFHDTECIDCEKLRLAPLVKIPCIELSKSPDGGQLRNGSYQAFIAYTINDQVVGDYYGISNIQPLFAHEDLLSGLELKITNLDTQFEYFQLVIVSNNQNEMQAKEIGFYSTHQSSISIDYINQALKAVPLTAIPLSTPAFEKSDHMYVVNDYLIRSGPYQQYDFNYQPLANEIHTHWTSVRFPSDYYKKGGNKTNFMRDEVYAFFIRFIYNTGEKSSSYHIPGRDTSININTNATPTNPYSFTWGGTTFTDESLPQPGNNDLSTLNWNNNGSFGPVTGDRLFEVYNTSPNGANNFWNLTQTSTDYFETDDGGVSIAEGHMAYWESTERYPNDPVRWNGVSGNPLYDLCGRPIRHHKFPDETHAGSIPPGGILDRSDTTAEHIHILGVNFWNIKWPRYSINSTGDVVDPNEGRPLGPLIPNIIGYEILVGSREGNKSIIAKGIARNMRQYAIPTNAQGQVQNTGTTGYIPNYPFNSAQADPFLSSANAFTWGNSTTTTQYDGTHNWDPYLAGGTFNNGDTAEDIFTIHSPELSFNRPFLSPWEIRTYGMCTGTSIGRFIKSEGHPKQKLLRNISMWVAIIVGIGYAMMEMRGKRKKKFTPPKALNVGQTGHGNERSGGSETNTLTAGVLVPGTMNPLIPPATVSGTSGTSGNIDTSQSGGDWDQAAPSSVDLTSGSDLLLDNNASMMTEYGNQGEEGAGATILDPSGASRNMQLSTLTMGGAPKLGMTGGGIVPLSYEATTQTAYSNITGTAGTTDRGFIGAGTSVEYEGSRFESAPSATQVLFGVFNFMNFTAEGGQHIIDLIYNLCSYQDYAFKYSGHGLYLSTQNLPAQGIHRMLVEKARYIGPTIQNLSANIKINNLQRPSTVALNSFAPNNQSFALPVQAEDDSRFTIGSFNGWYNPSQWRVAPIAAHYVSLKVAFKNQYGQIDQIKQLPTGCWFDWPSTHQQFGEDSDGNGFQVPLEDATYEGENALTFTYEDRPYTVNENTRFYTPTIFAGDTYINRYTEKVIMPFFWDFLQGQPDGFPYDYRLRANVPRPIYWMNSAKYDLSELVRYITGFGWLFGGSAALVGVLPNQMFFLDRDGTDLVQDGFGAGGGGTTGGAPPGGDTPTPGNDMGVTGSGGKSLFHIRNGYFYTHINGIQDFFCESTLNTGLRDWEDVNKKRHYDFADYTDTEAMFHADIIREDNFYKYDASLSRTRFNTQLVSWGLVQPRDYDPTVAAECFTHYPKRLIYSLQAQKEAKKDFWRVFLPMNYKDFKNRVNVIKPISKSGALVLFPNLAPAMFQGVDQLQTDLGTKLTIGDGGLFSQPMQNIVNADTAHEYGSCESARSVVNTPSGVFYISQAQGKIFQYNGQGIINIANQGMKQWFNKYLPSVLLNQFPELEECNGWIDNPVAGVGCQTVYDPNYDLVYFCKKDYEAINPECIEFIPCEGFFWNETLCGDQEVTYDCPPGYTYNPAAPAGRRCELITYQDPIPPNEGGINDVDVVFVLSSSSKTYEPSFGTDWGNIGNMQKFMRYVVEGLTEQLTEDKLRIGLCHYGAGRDTRSPLFKGQYSWSQDPDEMFEPFGIDSNTNGIMIGTGQINVGNQVPLTSTISRLETWIGQSSGQSGDIMNFSADTDSVYGKAASLIDKPRGSDIAGGYWVGLNLLYGQGSRNAKKLIIHLGDTYHEAYGSAAGTYSSEEYTLGITGNDVFAPDGISSMSVTPTTPEQDIGPKESTQVIGEQYDTNDNACNWIQDNVINNTTYTNDETFAQENLMVLFPPEIVEATDVENDIIPYFDEFADSGEVYRVQSGGSDNPETLWGYIQEHGDAIIEKITALVGVDDEEYDPCPDANCNLIYNEADQPLCECISVVSEVESNSNTPISLDDENYFKDVSWTVSYDPKAKAWISFHDWHPDLVIPSLNHFFTTKNFIDDSEPQCPPGMEYDPITQACCQIQHFAEPADVILDEEIPTVNEIAAHGCPLDIVLYVDSTGSTTWGGDLVWNAEKVFVDALTTALAPDMSDGNVQLGLYKWSSENPVGQNCTPGGFYMSNSTVSTTWGTDYLGAALDGSTPFFTAAFAAQGMLNTIDPGSTTLGDRTDQIGYKRVLLFMSDGGSTSPGGGFIQENGTDGFPNFQVSMSVDQYNNGGMGQPLTGPYTCNAELAGMTEVASETWGLYIFPGNTGVTNDYVQECFNIITYGRHPDGSYDLSWLPTDHALYDPTEPVDVDPTNYQNLALNSNDTPQLQQFANDLYENLNCIQWQCLCPDGFVHVSTPESMDPLDYSPTIVTDNITNCSPETAGTPIIGVCRRITCDCDEDNFNSTFIEGSFFTSGICDGDLGDQAIANYYAQSENFGYMLGDPNYINEDPLMCEYDGLCCIDPTFNKGGIWKHNDRCDLFTNYYEFDYPWEVEIVESKGQTVNTVRSVEYQLESYIYNGNLDDNCGDRFHDLDWNFDEVIIHNTEQVSGLLRLDLNPKNNAPLITDYPIVGINDIRILYSKEEQKYRFNQFWDITDDRGEFSQASQSIFLTELNGYIRELNQANLNYFKPAFEHKKFRHYWNKVIFRRSISENRKMILKLANTKINASFR